MRVTWQTVTPEHPRAESRWAGPTSTSTEAAFASRSFLPRERGVPVRGQRLTQTSARAAGFTLIEIIISSGLMALILVSGYLCLNAAMSSQKLIDPRVDIFQNARVAMALITADLRNACPLSKDYEFLGMHRNLGDIPADNLDFGTHNYTPKRAGEGDFCQTSVFLDKDPQSGQYTLWRRRNPHIGLDPLVGGRREELASGLLGVRFEYYDGIEWYDSWGDAELRGKAQSSNREHYNLEGLPEAVRITLWFDSNPRRTAAESTGSTNREPPMVFQTVARLNLADVPQASSGSGTPDSGAPNSSPQPMAPPTQ